MGLLAGHHAVIPADPQHALHNADNFLFIFKNRPLFNMRFKVGANRMVARRLAADIADTRQLRAHGFTVRILRGVDGLQREYPGKHAGAHHHRYKARPLFIGPEHHFNRRFGFNLPIVQGTYHLQRRQHAVVTVKFAAGRLGVNMAAGDNRRQRRITPFPAHKYVADFIDGDAHPGRLRPANHQIPSLAVKIGQRQTAAAALRRSANFRQRHQRIPQARAIDPAGGGFGYRGKKDITAHFGLLA